MIPRAFSFDLDGTLLDGSHFQESIVGTCEVIAAVQPVLSAGRLLEANESVWSDYWPGVEKRWQLGAEDSKSVSAEAWRRTLLACGYDDTALVELAVETHSRLERETYRLFDDARDLLTKVRTRRLPVALITNGASDTQRDKLRVLGIEQWFDTVVISGDLGMVKPDPAVFGAALDGLAVDGENLWHVGDSLADDVAGAEAAGLTSVWLNREGLLRPPGDPDPYMEIRSLSSLLKLLSE